MGRLRLPNDEDELFSALGQAWEKARAGLLVEVACDGGTGRTGTALACLAVLSGVAPDAAVGWVPANYHRYAVEAPEQEALIARFAEWVEGEDVVTDWDPARAPDWDEALRKEFMEGYWKQLHAFLSAERATYDVFPPRQEIFRAFHLTRLADTKVVIIGQDPYPTRGHAHGLCFSVPCGVGVPRSLANIKRELHDDLGGPTASHGNLEAWARSGVLLLNTVLTVRDGASRSHRGKGWERFTDRVVRLAAARPSAVFMLWGNDARAKAQLIGGPSSRIIASSHPSPQAAHQGFIGSRPFSRANDALVRAGETPIDWALGDC